MADRKVYVVQGEHNGSLWIDSVWSSWKRADDEVWARNHSEKRKHIRNRASYEMVEVTLNTERPREGWE